MVDIVGEALKQRRIIYCPKDCFMARRDGTAMPIEDSAAPIWGDDEALSGAVVVFKDRTESLAFERERDFVEGKLRETQKLESLGVLAGGIAHDFNNLLTGVLGNASMIRMEVPQGVRILDYVQEIESAALRAADLCKQMLAYAGKGRFQVAMIDLSELVKDAQPLIQLSISKRVSLNVHLPQGLPPVHADVTQLRQILMNLAINGSEAMEDRNGTLRISTGMVRADQAYLEELSVSPEIPE